MIHTFLPFSSPPHGDLRRYNCLTFPIYDERVVAFMSSEGNKKLRAKQGEKMSPNQKSKEGCHRE
jgi:hypothetical protein